MFDLTLLRQTSAERYSSTTDSYAIKLSSILCFFVCVAICVSIYDCVLNRVIERLGVSVIVRLWVHSIRGRLYCDTTYHLMLDWFDTCKQNFTSLFFRVKMFFFSKSKLSSSVFTQDQMSFFLCHWIWIENYILFNIETCQVSVKPVDHNIEVLDMIVKSREDVFRQDLGAFTWDTGWRRNCFDIFDSVDTRGIHRI